MTTKVCSKCKETKTTSEFGKASKNKDGLQCCCKACRKAYRESNKDKIAKAQKAYYQANKERIKAKSREYHKANREQCNIRSRDYQKRNAESVSKASKAYYRANKERILARSKAYNEANKETIKQKRRSYYKKYCQSNRVKEMKRLNEAKRRFLKKEATVFEFSYEDLKIFWLGQNILPGICYYCQKDMGDRPEHIDHYIPLIKLGAHSPVNLRPSCADCNLSKNDKLPIEFYQSKLIKGE